MSASDKRIVEVSAESSLASPREALAQALEAVLGKLIAAGAAPPHLTAMTWSGPDPAAIHPSNRAIDQERRMVFAGFRPPLAIRRSQDALIHVEARAAVPLQPPPADPVYRNYGVMELGRQMSPRNQVPDMGALFRQWTADGTRARARHRGLDISYGPQRDQLLDLYRPDGVSRPPVWVFIHGGYWQASNKEQHAQICDGMLKAGFAVANIEYGLAPETPLAAILGQIREALHFLVREADNLDIDAADMHVAGHSAGGYLAAMCACDEGMPPVRSAHLLSGIFDLESLVPIPFGPILGLTDNEIARRLSPCRLKPRHNARIGVAVGGLESDEFKRQSEEQARLWGAPKSLVVDGMHHFNLIDGLNGGVLLDQQIALARG